MYVEIPYRGIAECGSLGYDNEWLRRDGGHNCWRERIEKWSVGWIIYTDVEFSNLKLCILPLTRVVLFPEHRILREDLLTELLFHMTIKFQPETSFCCAQVRQK